MCYLNVWYYKEKLDASDSYRSKDKYYVYSLGMFKMCNLTNTSGQRKTKVKQWYPREWIITRSGLGINADVNALAETV